MSAQKDQPTVPKAPGFESILLALDASDQANHGITEAVRLGRIWSARITGTHVYAAQLHDNRFRQMEGGLPEQFRRESELERQRDVHDDLIGRGLAIITDSYLSQAELACQEAGLEFTGKPLEGKNYRGLTEEANRQGHDLLIMGAQGLGALENSTPGSVCRRVTRAANLDVLVIKNASQDLDVGPILVTVDGSGRAWGGLVTALELAKQWNSRVEVIAAFDPFYHYVAFNKIAEVLSDEARKVFRFEEQEKLHEEIIDSGLARIYQSHLDIACDLAKERGVTITTKLLAGKAHAAIEKHAEEVGATLVFAGKTGIHSDPELDIGGNTELLLQNLQCALWISNREHQPKVEMIAEATTSWTAEATARLKRAPVFVQGMARAAVLRYAQERGHTVITENMVAEVSAQLMPARAQEKMALMVEASESAQTDSSSATWQAAALARLARVPAGSMRESCKSKAEALARETDTNAIDLKFIEQVIADARKGMAAPLEKTQSHPWDAQAVEMLQTVPEGYCREMTQDAVNAIAQAKGISAITPEFVTVVMETISASSENITSQLNWSAAAKTRIQAVPESVRGMLIKEIESWVLRQGIDEVDTVHMDAVKEQWQAKGFFHLDPADDRHQS